MAISQMTYGPTGTDRTNHHLHRTVEIPLHRPDLTSFRIVAQEHEAMARHADVVAMDWCLLTQSGNVATEIVGILFTKQIV